MPIQIIQQHFQEVLETESKLYLNGNLQDMFDILDPEYIVKIESVEDAEFVLLA